MSDSATVTEEVSAALHPVDQERDWRRRWQELENALAELLEPRRDGMSSDGIHAARRAVHAFYIQAYHLKDAVKAERPGGLSPPAVEAAINAEPDLALLADLANLDKHVKLNVAPRSGDVPRVVSVSAVTSKGPGRGWGLVMKIGHRGRTLNGLQVAEAAMDAWRRQLSGWRLV